MNPYLIVSFVIVASALIYTAHSPKYRLEIVSDWRSLHTKFSVRVAALAGSLQLLPSIAKQVQDMLPQIQQVQGVPYLDQLIHSPAYAQACGFLTLFIIVARNVKLPAKQ